jgi:hypothetical protein
MLKVIGVEATCASSGCVFSYFVKQATSMLARHGEQIRIFALELCLGTHPRWQLSGLSGRRVRERSMITPKHNLIEQPHRPPIRVEPGHE